MSFKLYEGSYLFLSAISFLLGFLLIENDITEVGLTVCTISIFGIIRYTLFRKDSEFPNKITTHDPIEFKKQDYHFESKNLLYPFYQIVWLNEIGEEIKPILLSEEDCSEMKMGRPFKYDDSDIFAALIFIYGAPGNFNELSNEKIEEMVFKIANESSEKNDDIFSANIELKVLDLCKEVMNFCGSTFGFNFMIVYNIGAFKLSGDSLFRRNATLDLYNMIEKEKSSRELKTDSGNLVIDSHSFYVEVAKKKFRCKDRRVEYAVSTVLNESVCKGLPDFNEKEKMLILENLNILILN